MNRTNIDGVVGKFNSPLVLRVLYSLALAAGCSSSVQTKPVANPPSEENVGAPAKDEQSVFEKNSDVDFCGKSWALTTTKLVCEDTAIHSLAPLSKLVGLKVLFLKNAAVSDLRPLAGLGDLMVLFLSGTNVKDLSPLFGLTNIYTLSLEDTPVSDIRPLADLIGLEVLWLEGTQVSDISPLADLPKLSKLYGVGQQVSILTPLQNLGTLRTLFLKGAPVPDAEVHKLKALLPQLEVFH